MIAAALFGLYTGLAIAALTHLARTLLRAITRHRSHR